MDCITIDVGTENKRLIDLTEVDFEGITKVVLSIKNANLPDNEVIIQREYTTADKHTLTISAEESKLLNKYAIYDLVIVDDEGKAMKLADNGHILLRSGVYEQNN